MDEQHSLVVYVPPQTPKTFTKKVKVLRKKPAYKVTVEKPKALNEPLISWHEKAEKQKQQQQAQQSRQQASQARQQAQHQQASGSSSNPPPVVKPVSQVAPVAPKSKKQNLVPWYQRLKEFPTRHVEENHQRELAKAKARIKRQREDALIARSKAPPKGYGRILGVNIKKHKQGRKLSRKSRIRLI